MPSMPQFTSQGWFYFSFYKKFHFLKMFKASRELFQEIVKIRFENGFFSQKFMFIPFFAVRVEQAAVGYNTTQHPGYVDEDVEEVATDTRKSPLEEPIVKEIVDENGDDELAVVAEVEQCVSLIFPFSLKKMEIS